MTTLLMKRMFNFGGENYLYKMEKTAPNEIQKVFGRVAEKDKNDRLDFLPKTGITHKIEFDTFTGQPKSFEKMHKELDDFGHYDLSGTESVHKSNDKFPYWVTLKGNKFETAYVKAEDVNSIKTPNVKTRIVERDYENEPIGYDRIYSNQDGDVLEYSYFPNVLDPRMKNLHPVQDTLNEDNILEKAERLINRIKNLKTQNNF